jgi:hypothetical protein
MTSAELNHRLAQIWQRHRSDKRQPLVYREMDKSCLMFVGLNPSYIVSGQSLKVVSGGVDSTIDCDDHYHWKGIQAFEDFLGRELPNIPTRVTESAPYFKPIRSISARCGIEWEHIDLFAVRETNQNEAKRIIGISGSTEKDIVLSDFARDQMEVMFRFIHDLHPKGIVVINALGSSIFQWWCRQVNISLEFADERGFHQIKQGNSLVPVFFSGMLTGQRALDRHSFERLKWHISRALS